MAMIQFDRLTHVLSIRKESTWFDLFKICIGFTLLEFKRSIGNITLTTLNTAMDSEGKEMSELNLHKAVILGENAGCNKKASILYPLCMKSGCFHCHTGHE